MTAIEENLSSIQIDDDDPAFLLDRQEDNVSTFVAATNGLSAAQAPPWLRTPLITARSFIDDVIYRLEPPLAGGRFGHIMLVPNNHQQHTAAAATLITLQHDEFLQDAMRLALLTLPVVKNVVRYFAFTAHLADSRVQKVRLNNLPPSPRNGRPMRQLFI
ncbi:hypothetical protein GN244_ATG04682 [Phytophthora infestans]|uniref:Uncharacterized protein n=1 Tax=Phytophthora infestans TaxID=4787 RepID=A0A833TBE7_PHYIN|nr:hypothetical protein GN244_ATG04682 [Phytophthora infestans]